VCAWGWCGGRTRILLCVRDEPDVPVLTRIPLCPFSIFPPQGGHVLQQQPGPHPVKVHGGGMASHLVVGVRCACLEFVTRDSCVATRNQRVPPPHPRPRPPRPSPPPFPFCSW
jgi:hypothetical protein